MKNPLTIQKRQMQKIIQNNLMAGQRKANKLFKQFLISKLVTLKKQKANEKHKS